MQRSQVKKTEEASFQTQNEEKRCSSITNDTEYQRYSDSVTFDVTDLPSDSLSKSLINQKLTCKLVENPSLSPVVLKKAINWLITFCWTKDFSNEVLWNSVGYFYAHLNSKILKKEKLTLLLLAIVHVSIKLIQPSKTLKIHELQHVLITESDRQVFLQMEQELVESFGFELYFDNNLNKILSSKIPSEIKDQILFLCEVLFLESYEVAINGEYLGDLIMLIQDSQCQNLTKKDLKQLEKAPKLIQNIKMKYMSKFDVHQFWEKIIA